MTATGFFAGWWNLPHDPEYSKLAWKWTLIMNFVQFILFFVIAPYHPLPSSLAKKLKKPYDRMVVGHRLVCLYNGFGAFLVSTYWWLFVRDIQCGKQNSLIETILFANMSAHLLWDTLFMKYQGFLDFGNLLHHFMAVVVYNSGLYFQHNMYMNIMHIFFGDMTNAPMHLREIFKRFGMRYTWCYYFNEYFYCAGYMFCRGLVIPILSYVYFTCDSTGPIFLFFYPIHVVQSLYYVSCLPKMWGIRNSERTKLKKAKLTLKWFEPISAEQAKEAGVGSFEAYKM